MGEIKLIPNQGYPCDRVNLIVEGQDELVATLYTSKKFNRNHFRYSEGVIHAADNIFDIIVDSKMITVDITRKWVKTLSRMTGVNYQLAT